MLTTHPSRPAGKSQAQTILECLQLHRGAWVSMLHLHQQSGSMAVHSRISDLRSAGHDIEHKNETVERIVHSYYRLKPIAPIQGRLF
jgi:biotin operon repressor